MLDEAVCCPHDGLCATVVALQFEEFGIGIALLEGQNILDIRSAEGINRLRIISHHANMVLRFGELTHDEVLNMVGVLILIHEDVMEDPLVIPENFRMLAEEQAAVDQQVVKVHRISSLKPRLVVLVEPAHLVEPVVSVVFLNLCIPCVHLGRDETVLCR